MPSSSTVRASGGIDPGMDPADVRVVAAARDEEEEPGMLAAGVASIGALAVGGREIGIIVRSTRSGLADRVDRTRLALRLIRPEGGARIRSGVRPEVRTGAGPMSRPDDITRDRFRVLEDRA